MTTLDRNRTEGLIRQALPRFLKSNSYRTLTDSFWSEPDEDYGVPPSIPQEVKDRLAHLCAGPSFIGNRDGEYVVVWEHDFPCFDKGDVFEAARKWNCGLADVPNSLEILVALESRCAVLESLYPGIEFHSGLDDQGSPMLVAFGRADTPSLIGTNFEFDIEALPPARKMTEDELRGVFGDAYDRLAPSLKNERVEAVIEAFTPRP